MICYRKNLYCHFNVPRADFLRFSQDMLEKLSETIKVLLQSSIERQTYFGSDYQYEFGAEGELVEIHFVK